MTIRVSNLSGLDKVVSLKYELIVFRTTDSAHPPRWPKGTKLWHANVAYQNDGSQTVAGLGTFPAKSKRAANEEAERRLRRWLHR